MSITKTVGTKKDTAKTTQHLKCVLTDEQLLVCGQKLAEASQKLGAIESEKKRVTDDFKAQTSREESEIAILSNKISTRSEYRDVECTVVFGDPKDGFKTTYRDDTSEQIACGPMTAEEKQRKLPLDESIASKVADGFVKHYRENPQPGVTVTKVK